MAFEESQKWQLRAIVSRRLERQVPISAITEKFVIMKKPGQSASVQPKLASVRTPHINKQELLRSASYKATEAIGPKVNFSPPVKKSKLCYPKQVELGNLAVTELDGFVVKNGKAVRRGEEEEARESVERYRLQGLGEKPNFDDLLQLNKRSVELRKELGRIRGPLKRRSLTETFSPSEKVKPPQITLSKSRSARFRCMQTNVLQFNQTSLYNIISPNPIPRRDVQWTRSLLKSPFTFDTSKWRDTDPRLTHRAAIGSTQLLLQENRGATAQVVVRYPYCHSCVRHAEPITVHLSP